MCNFLLDALKLHLLVCLLFLITHHVSHIAFELLALVVKKFINVWRTCKHEKHEGGCRVPEEVLLVLLAVLVLDFPYCLKTTSAARIISLLKLHYCLLDEFVTDASR